MDGKEKIWSYEFEKHKEIKAGTLLLSEPFMFDENFRRTVVLICEHEVESGTVGLILNRPVHLRLQDVLEDFPALKTTLYLGGPVGTDTLQFLHSRGGDIEDSIKLTEDLFWGGNFEQVKTMLTNGDLTLQEIRFFLGYSGWGHEQLIEEMKANSWIVAQARASHIFREDIDVLWKEILNSMGGVYHTMANYPENPILN